MDALNCWRCMIIVLILDLYHVIGTNEAFCLRDCEGDGEVDDSLMFSDDFVSNPYIIHFDVVVSIDIHWFPDAHRVEVWSPIPWILIAWLSSMSINEWHSIHLVCLFFYHFRWFYGYFDLICSCKNAWLVYFDPLLYECIFGCSDFLVVEGDSGVSVYALEN